MKNKLKIFNLVLILVFLFSCAACNNPKPATETTSVITTVTDAEAKEDVLDYSKDILALNDRINSITVENTSLERNKLLMQIDDFTKRSVNGNGFSSSIYSLIKVRLDQALKEISTIKVPQGNIKIWYIYNMGVIAKSEDKTIAFDLAGDYVYPNMADFTKYIDILVISHFHGDHINRSVFKEALKNGATVIIPGDKVFFNGSEFIRDPEGEDAVTLIKRRNGIDSDNFISIKPQEKTIIKGIEITAYPAKHIHNPDAENLFIDTPVNWYYVNLSGFTILHTGDGTSFDYKLDFTDKNINVFIIHSTTLDPLANDTLMKLVPNPGVIIPLHVLELGHGSSIVSRNQEQCMTYQSILDNYSNGYYKGIDGNTRFIPMIWGESILF